jgi:hypothetical protein
MAIYTITNNNGMMPNQIEGTIDDGRFFYFRARHAWATLYIGASLDECHEGIEFGPDQTMVWCKYIVGAGWFELEEFEALFWQVIAELEA